MSGGTVAVDLAISANGGVVEGVAVDRKGEPAANAVVVAVPDGRMRARVDHYRKTVTDQSGRFKLGGLRPGDYTVLAWESVEGEAYYDPEFVKLYEGQGSSVRVAEGERKSLQVEAIAEGVDSQ